MKDDRSEITGTIVGVNGNMLTVECHGAISQNEVGFVELGDLSLMAEVIRIRGKLADMQVFEDTSNIRVGDKINFAGHLLSVELGPGLLGQVYDGLQNPLHDVADKYGFFLQRGAYLDALPLDQKWEFTPKAHKGDTTSAGETLGSVPEGIFDHRIMVPFELQGKYTVEEISPEGSYTVKDTIARLKDQDGKVHDIQMLQRWPVKIPITAYEERLGPSDPLTTKIRIIDTFFPVALGGTYCIPGPFGSGKTVLQQITSRHADVDIVIVAACGERAGEVVETLRTFPELEDPRTGRKLMERTIIICNTSSMPVAAREASVYTAVTLGSYYRQMGLNVLVLADSTSRWAQALREVSGRLEEIPGEEAYPAYLESVIASFYERGGRLRLKDGSTGSITIGGTVSPAGGNFDEPVTQSTLKVVGAFHGLARARSDARRYPAIDPLDSWTTYKGVVPEEDAQMARNILHHGNDVGQMMKVVGEEGTTLDDFIIYLKAEYVDSVYLQQDAFDPVDGATDAERQKHVFAVISDILKTQMDFENKDAARRFFHQLTQTTKDWNRVEMKSDEFKQLQEKIGNAVSEVARNA